MKKLLFILGTRPEAIKLAPLIIKYKETGLHDIKVCMTGQHREMVDQVMDFFELKSDYDLNLMKSDQTLFDTTVNALKGLEKVLDDCRPDMIFVQGDTTTVFAGALAGFYKNIKIVHIEAGLRSGDKQSPFPEEINRILSGHLADFHFAPTGTAKENLRKENIVSNVWISGNTVIDALFKTLELIDEKELTQDFVSHFTKDINNFRDILENDRVVLVTAHRRESFGEPFENICNAVRELAEEYQNVHFIYPVHLNPNVRKTVFGILNGIRNVHLIEPLDYPKMIWLIKQSYLVLTDSGGVQEEAPSLEKPVLVMRDVTERMEGVMAGTAKLVGTKKDAIVREVQILLDDRQAYTDMAKAVNPYGDGNASEKIIDILEDFLSACDK